MTHGVLSPLPFESILPSFGPPFMAHVSAGKVGMVAPLTASDNVGVVIVTSGDASARAAVKTIRRSNPAASILIDKDRYSGHNRRIGADAMSAKWLTMQLRDLNLPWALTDSGYIPAGDTRALRAVLRWGKLGDRIVVTLPLAREWICQDVDQLIDEITEVACPVGIILEDKADPLSTRLAVQGLIKLLRAIERVLVLRCDTSTLGALAYGAAAVSVGASSTHRHLYPIVKRKSDEEKQFRRAKVRTAVFVPDLLSYRLLNERVVLAIVRQPDLPAWVCNCSQCHNRSLIWITTVTDPDTAAFQHSLCAQGDLARALLQVAPLDRPSWWRDRCADAHHACGKIFDENGVPWQTTGAIRAWVGSTPTPQELRG